MTWTIELISMTESCNNSLLSTNNGMKFRVQLAEYKRSVYKDTDAGWIVTIKFPYLDYITDGDEIYSFDFKEFISKMQDGIASLCTGPAEYKAIRLHGFEHNQPVRFTFPDYGPPNIIVVLQVFINDDQAEKLYKQPLFFKY